MNGGCCPARANDRELDRVVLDADDLVAAADFLDHALCPHIERDWSQRAGLLEWDVALTITHLAGGLISSDTPHTSLRRQRGGRRC
jgi:hypothetical protein